MLDLIKLDVTREVNKKLLYSNNSTLKSDDCAVPEEVEHGMPLVVMETPWKDAPPLTATPSGEISSSERQSHQLDPRPELITACAGRVVKPPHRLKDYVCA